MKQKEIHKKYIRKEYFDMVLNCVRILVEDFDKCFRFYSEKLGLKATWGEIGGVYASFDIGIPSGLSIFKSDLMAEAVNNFDRPFPKNCRDKIAIILKTVDVDKLYVELCDKGISFVAEPKDMPSWGMRVVHVRDPEDNLIEIWSELPQEKWDESLLEESQKHEAQ